LQKQVTDLTAAATKHATDLVSDVRPSWTHLINAYQDNAKQIEARIEDADIAIESTPTEANGIINALALAIKYSDGDLHDKEAARRRSIIIIIRYLGSALKAESEVLSG
jgi:hypothetical protein